jgi:hypothetical protein
MGRKRRGVSIPFHASQLGRRGRALIPDSASVNTISKRVTYENHKGDLDSASLPSRPFTVFLDTPVSPIRAGFFFKLFHWSLLYSSSRWRHTATTMSPASWSNNFRSSTITLALRKNGLFFLTLTQVCLFSMGANATFRVAKVSHRPPPH